MTFDIFAIIVILALFINGISKGAIYMLFNFAKFILAIVLVPYFYKYIYKMFKIEHQYINYIITFFIIFIILSLIIKLADNIIRYINLGSFNSLLGASIGLIQSFFVIYISMCLLIFFAKYNNKAKNTLYTSYVAYYMSIISKPINSAFPEKIKKQLDEFSDYNKKIKLSNEIFNIIKIGKTNEN